MVSESSVEPVKNDAQATFTLGKELKDNRASTLVSFQPELIFGFGELYLSLLYVSSI